MSKKFYGFSLNSENVDKIRKIIIERDTSLSDFIDVLIEDFILNNDRGGKNGRIYFKGKKWKN